MQPKEGTFEYYELNDVLDDCFKKATEASSTSAGEKFVRAYMDGSELQTALCALIAAGVATSAARRALELRHESTQLSLF